MAESILGRRVTTTIIGPSAGEWGAAGVWGIFGGPFVV